jgi:hypothetical protein
MGLFGRGDKSGGAAATAAAAADTGDGGGGDGGGNGNEGASMSSATAVAADPVKLVQGDYVVLVHVIEVRDLVGRGVDAMADPVVVVDCLDKRESTKVYKRTLSTQINETKDFELSNVHPHVLERGTVAVRVYDANSVRSDVLIGSYTFDMTQVYYSKHHEVYRRWVALTNAADDAHPVCSASVQWYQHYRWTHLYGPYYTLFTKYTCVYCMTLTRYVVQVCIVCFHLFRVALACTCT